MKLIHLSDLHIGKRVNDVSMLEDQRHILSQILLVTEQEKPDAVLIAGDIYDKSVPSGEAVVLFDAFLCSLSSLGVRVMAISGNHDSPERLAFGGRLMELSGIHISPVYDGNINPISLEDPYGTVDFWLLPFVKPAHVRRFFPDEQIDSYTDACSAAVSRMPMNPTHRNVLIAHQFVTGAERCDSEERSVGGVDHVDVSVFDSFDYVALGHIHGPQNVGSQRIRYCGTPLKYSFSEAHHHKSVSVVEIREKGKLEIRTVPLVPLREMRELRGSYQELTQRSFYDESGVNDYLHITLTDEDDVPEAIGRLRAIYCNLMSLDYDNTRTRSGAVIDKAEDIGIKSPLQLFGELYELQNGRPMTDVQEQFMSRLIESVWEEQL